MKEMKSIKITTIVDNNVWKKGLAPSRGLSFQAEVICWKTKLDFL